MKIIIIKEKADPKELLEVVKDSYDTMVKIAVDINKRIATAGGEWHSEGQDILVKEAGSLGVDVWGCNLYPWNEPEKRIEYVSLINIKPAIGHKNMEIENKEIRHKIKSIVEDLIIGPTETI